jgi:hypothetical protein
MSKKPKRKDKDKPAVTLPATVEKIIPPIPPDRPEKAQIAVEGAEELYKELRVENALKDQKGEEVGMKEGSQVEVTIEADPKATEPKKGAGTKINPPRR